ncbi:hypothetical protein H0H81_009118 [Sphagnurus paluster]|uniref:DUF5648 domain-containing protein n=1 Tax=Sphagnurus paluster TaxID=117069 RepID=A0A9P7GIM0_9AGAR|nr:hypothetical protein H0H81_009118 [Sphagnurus paluster]
MKHTLSFAIALVAHVSAVAVGDHPNKLQVPRPLTDTLHPLTQSLFQARTCGDPANAVPLYRAFNSGDIDHLYTTSTLEIQTVTKAGTFISEGVAGKVFPTQEIGTVPFYRLYSGGLQDHFYTASAVERDAAIRTLGYISEGIVGYVYADAGCGGWALYRLLRPAPVSDHLYTLSTVEVAAVQAAGYKYEGVAAYIRPA